MKAAASTAISIGAMLMAAAFTGIMIFVLHITLTAIGNILERL